MDNQVHKAVVFPTGANSVAYAYASISSNALQVELTVDGEFFKNYCNKCKREMVSMTEKDFKGGIETFKLKKCEHHTNNVKITVKSI